MANSDTPAQPIFIDFEGIDGSGKTTLSNRLAQYLKKQGIPVHHARDRGVFRSEISKEIRLLTRNPKFLRMSDVTEFLLYVARDTQSIDEFIRPKLLPGNIVFADRYLYSTVTHSHFARGLPREEVDAVLRLAARGLWPDLVVYCDVDPLTSRIRKKIQKVRDKREMGDFGRKGLMGIGFREDMREGFLELAQEDPDRWLVIDNAHATIEESMQRIFDRVVKVLEAKGYPSIQNPLWVAPENVAESGPRVVTELSRSVEDLLGIADEKQRQDAVYPLFFSHLDRLSETNPGYAALFVGGLDLPEAHTVRERVIDAEPAMVAHGLQGLRSPESFAFRRRLQQGEPEYVARSLSGLPMELPEAAVLRDELVEAAPRHVALSLRGKNSEAAWALRDRIGKRAIREVLLSVRGIDTEQAWALRESRAKSEHFPALLESLGSIDTPQAWEWREKLIGEHLPWVLMSLSGLESERSWDLREEHVARAPKTVVKTIGCSQHPRAWKLREAARFYAKEVLDSLSGLDTGPAWALRLELKEKWPNTAVSSVGARVQSERAWKFRWDMLRANPDNLLLMKHLVKASLRTLDSLDDDEDEVDFT